MTTEREQAYLWDPSAPVDEGVRAVEEAVGSLRFDPAARPLPKLGRPSSRRRVWFALGAAALIVIAVGAAWTWRWSWPAGRAWPISNGRGEARVLAVGQPFTLSSSERVTVGVARIGTMEVEGGSQLVLRSTTANRHRLTMARGRVRLRTWAPPGSVAIQTPAGDVIDLGCEFELTADESRTDVRVLSGWVQIENGVDETLVPAGAAASVRPGESPTVPVFEDATSDFKTAVRALERGDATAVDVAVAAARPRDVLTLLLLVERLAPGRERLANRAAELRPPPADVTVMGALRDRDTLWRWVDALPLPPTKSWLLNWRDGLPAWLVGR